MPTSLARRQARRSSRIHIASIFGDTSVIVLSAALIAHRRQRSIMPRFNMAAANTLHAYHTRSILTAAEQEESILFCTGRAATDDACPLPP